ncbi:uncharacterized protein ACNS7B_004862 isoform 2-T2 [Menidia menidia]
MKTVSFFCCFLYGVLTESAEISVEGDEGGEVSFVCSHRLAHNNNKYLCYDPCTSEEDTLLTVTAGGMAASGRITLVDSGHGAFTVMFRDLQLSDSRLYNCAVQRLGLDTYTSVLLTVHKAATLEPVVSSSWTYQNLSNQTTLTTGTKTVKLENVSTETTSTPDGDEDISMSIMSCATFGTIAIVTILITAVCFRKCCSRNKSSALEMEVEHQYDDKKVRCVAKISGGDTLRRQHPQVSASAGTEPSLAFPTYENLPPLKGSAHSPYLPSNHQHSDHVITSRIYINPLPFVASKRGSDHRSKEA